MGADRKEFLAIFPAPRPNQVYEGRGMQLLRDLSREWRVFWCHAPSKGEVLPVGSSGFDTVSSDTLPAICQILSEQVISAVWLVGERAFRDCIQPLHAFASHIPYLVLLDQPWLQNRNGSPIDWDSVEFQLSLADKIFLTDATFHPSLDLFLRRLSVGVEALPDPNRKAGWERFLARISGEVSVLSQRIKDSGMEKDGVDLVALMREPSSFLGFKEQVREWRRYFPFVRNWQLLVSQKLPASWLGQAKRWWPGLSELRYRDGEDAVAQLNRALARCSKEFVLLLASSVRAHPILAERLLRCARELPLCGAVGSNRAQDAPPQDWGQWVAFAQAWGMKHRGAHHSVNRLEEDCFLLRRSILERVGCLDECLGWNFALNDLWRRMRQAGFGLWLAEDAVTYSCPKTGSWDGQPYYKERFVQKWKLDPLDLLSQTR